MYISNQNSVVGTQIVCADAGDRVDRCIAEALKQVAKPDVAYSYFDHQGVIITLDKTSTAESVLADWQARTRTCYEVYCAAHPRDTRQFA